MFRKHIIKVLALLVFFAFATEPTYAQSRKKSSSSLSKKKKKKAAAKKKKEKEKAKAAAEEEESKPSTTFTDHLWYGGGVGLGLSSAYGVNSFGISVSPMVGYKLNNWFSVGPRASLAFSSLKIPGYKSINLFNIEAGGFVRAHVYEGFFLQGEISNEWIQLPDEAVGNEYTKVTQSRFNQYLGAGYNFGRGQGGVGSEISLHYNFAVGRDINTGISPFNYRFGFTWRF
jgi:hypothetical protein